MLPATSDNTIDSSIDVEEDSVVLMLDGVAEGIIGALEKMKVLGVVVDDECQTKRDADAVLMIVTHLQMGLKILRMRMKLLNNG